jgi:YesN/AraC family two-component response regulator
MKYLFSYLIVLSIPLLLFTIFSYKYSINELRLETEQSSLYKLSQVRNILDIRLRELEHISTRIAHNPRLTPFMFKRSVDKTMEGIYELQNYKLNSSIIDRLLIYYRDDERIYSSDGSLKLGVFYDNILNINIDQQREFSQIISSISEPTFIDIGSLGSSNNRENRYIVYVYPLGYVSADSNVLIIYCINKSIIKDLLTDIIGENLQGIVYVTDYNNNVLFMTSNELEMHQELIDTIYEGYKEPGVYGNLKLNNERYSAIISTSDIAKWRFVSIIPSDQFMYKIFRLETILLLLILMAAFLGIGISLILSLNLYKPVEIMINQNTRLKNVLDVQEPLVRDQVLQRLLKEKISDQSEIISLLLAGNISVVGKLYGVMVIMTYVDKEEKINRVSFINILKSVFADSHRIYPTAMIDENVIAILYSLDDINQIRVQQERIIHIIKNSFHENGYDKVFMIGVGKVKEDLLYIYNSYYEALSAAEYKVSSNRNIVYFDEIIESANQKIWYPVEEQIYVLQALKQADNVMAKQQLKSMLEVIMKRNLPRPMIKLICADIINSIVRLINDMQLDIEVNRIETIFTFETLIDFESKLNNIIEGVCLCIVSKKQQNELYNQILEYMHCHIYSYDMTLDKLSDSFGIPSYKLSKMFKEEMGQTFTNYITDYRIKEVKKQLLETSKTIKEIVVNVGYFDVPSFMRKFKHHEGITPGEFRKLYGAMKDRNNESLK